MQVEKRLTVMALLCTMVISAFAQKEKTSAFDSIQHVDEVVVLSNLTFREVIPSHTLKGEQLERLNSHSIADALRYFAGVQLKDYGGVGGIKTINVRSMGSNHLGIYYDGIQLGNAQNGQIDLGQFSMDNVEEISLYNGQKSAIFQPASEFGNAGTVYIRTRRPHFSNGERTHLKARVKYGSSDLIRFSTLWEQRLSASVTSSVGAEVMNASGKYKFRYRRYKADGSLAYDTTATRQNGDVWAVRAEGNLYGAMEQGGWNVKAYIIKDWYYVDLSSLGKVKRLGFTMSSSDNDPTYGMKTPAYFCMDNFGAEGTEVIPEGDPTLGIAEANATKATAVAIYDLNGRQLNARQRGMNIIRMSDGSVRKVNVK